MREAANDGTLVIDARTTDEFHGFTRGRDVARRGHVPGAHCEPWRSNFTSAGTYLPAEALRAKYENVVRDPEKRIIVYCRTGMDASIPYFVLRSLGYSVALHDGSYVEWSRDRSLPIAKLSQRP
jgi:thiosulfate/3-mercaptopyruvate sulfurtransferase